MNPEKYRKWEEYGNEDLRYNYPDLNEHSLVFDVGLYKGGFAERIHNTYGCIVYGFEPVHSFFEDARKKLNPNPKLQLFNHGLSAITEWCEIVVDGDSSSTFNGNPSDKEKIQLIGINDFLATHHISSVDLLKINIEGGEFDLLESLLSSGNISIFKEIQVQFHEFVPEADDRRLGILEKLSETHSPTYSFPFVWENFSKKKL